MADDDLKASLPEPPLPAPARREAAISEARRRFEGGTPTSAAQPTPGRGNRGSWVRRPQLAAFVTLGLMAIIGMPAAWVSLDRKTANDHPAIVAQDIATSSSSADSNNKVRGASVPVPVVAQASAPPRTTAPSVVVEKPRETVAGKTDTPVVVVPAPSTETAQLDAAPIAGAKAGGGGFTAPSGYSRFRSVPPPPPPAAIVAAAPAAPAPAPGLAARSEAPAGDIMVTGSRVSRLSAGRGDWNACTVDDPRRSLALCRDQVDPGSSGSKGLAAARVADGLARAWTGDTNGAIQAFDAAIATQPKLSQAYLNRSLLYARLGDEDRALSDADKAVRYARRSAQAYYNRSVVLRRFGKTDEASADEAHAAEIDPR